MEPKEDCKHENFAVEAKINRISDKEPMQFYADIAIRCADCGIPFRFIGVEDFGVAPDRPCLNVDSTELTIPIAPGPAQFIPTRMVFKVN